MGRTASRTSSSTMILAGSRRLIGGGTLGASVTTALMGSPREAPASPRTAAPPLGPTARGVVCADPDPAPQTHAANTVMTASKTPQTVRRAMALLLEDRGVPTADSNWPSMGRRQSAPL